MPAAEKTALWKRLLKKENASPLLRNISFLFFPILLISASLLTGCSTYTQQIQKANNYYYSGNIKQAKIEILKKSAKKQKSRDALVWKLEEGAVFRTDGDLPASTKSFNEADQIIRKYEESFADTRLGQETLATFSNPANITYEGWTTDRIMISTYLALNELFQGNIENARVHFNKAYLRQQDAVNKNARKIEQIQSSIAANELSREATSNSNISKNLSSLYTPLNQLHPLANYVNPFTSYVRGLFFLFYAADASDLETAHKSLQQAYSLANNNLFIGKDIQMSEQILEGLPAETNITYILFESGRAPYLSEYTLNIPLPINNAIYPVNIAFPIFTPSYSNNSLRVSTSSNTSQTDIIANMNDIFGTDFKSELPTIIARTIAATAIRQAANITANQALKNTDSSVQLLSGLALYIIQTSINIADTRSWTLLPSNFQLCRIPTPIDGKITLRETKGSQSVSIQLPNMGPYLIYVKSIGPNIKMTTWVHSLPK